MADQQKVAYGLANGAIFNDLERPLTWFSSTATVTIEGEQETAPKLSNGTKFQGHAIFSDLELPLSNPDFKVRQIFDVEYGINGTKQTLCLNEP